MKTITIRLITLLSAMSFSSVALAHTGLETGSGLMSGILHPLTGLDHLALMLLVGVWASKGINLQKWLPLMAVPVFMFIGAMLAMVGIGFSGIETMIALSVLTIGLFLISGANVQNISTGVIAVFALFHGQAHMLEMAVSASPLVYTFGFLLTSASLLSAGLASGHYLQRIHSEWVLRGAGLISGGFGTFLLISAS